MSLQYGAPVTASSSSTQAPQTLDGDASVTSSEVVAVLAAVQDDNELLALIDPYYGPARVVRNRTSHGRSRR